MTDHMKIGRGEFTRGYVVARVIDQYGEERVIHKTKGARLSVKRLGNTPSHALNRVAAIHIGERIREARQAAGLSMAELCEKAGLASATPKQRMREIEKATRGQSIRIGTLYAIALALDMPISAFLPDPAEIAEEAGVAEVSRASLAVGL